MRVAITSEGSGDLDSAVSPHFGRCPQFVLVDLDDAGLRTVSRVANPFAGSHEPGQIPHFMASQNVQVMVSGGMGWRAIAAFEQLGIRAVTGAVSSVREALEDYLAGKLQGGDPCLESRHGD